ncbi:hypothetical protein MLD38_036026 [Melastoma candidum]|uniref:Uncharacterized protein n=1 Tax=Melastoma candidum TaxID=119954 RepID=A0ACB9LIA6_9MYRT|nr:hypothetical protein MLD38_036026 [Melastoma candidum]
MNSLFLLLLLLRLIPFLCSAQSTSPSAPAPSPSPSEACPSGIFLSYAYTGGSQIPPRNASHQPYRFQSQLTVLNNGPDTLLSWKAFVLFQHDELLVSLSNAILADGSALPANVGDGSNATFFVGSLGGSDLKSGILTAGDLTQMQAVVSMVGTQFGVGSPAVPMPKNIGLGNDGWVCPQASLQGTTEMRVCCARDPNFKSNLTVDDGFLPRQNGDLTIMYDVIQTYDSNYWAQVTIANDNPIGRLDNWKLSWDWTNNEFIFAMKGAYPYVVDSSECIFGAQGQYYQKMDFSNVLNCEKRPTIIDLPPTKANDTNLGLIPNCCRNGTILPTWMDPTKSTSVFRMQVFKMEPDLNRSVINPPINFRINGTFNPDYQCGQPIQVSPSLFPDPSGLPVNTSAVASWQVVCNITQAKASTPKCCVSFSAYYNDSVVPCGTCACGCSSSTSQSQTCSTTAPAILLPSQALLVPFENRTALAVAWAELKHRTLPSPLPCGDNCGVSINWHVYTDYTRGWSARITVFNWDEVAFPDWFAAVELDKAAAGFQAMYSFNSTVLDAGSGNNTIVMQGKPGLNYLVAEAEAADPTKNPPVPGKQQSMLSFTKKATPGINIAAGDGFPTKVFFNGEECALPAMFPTNSSPRANPSLFYTLLIAVMLLKMMVR